MSGTPIKTEHVDALLRRARYGSAIEGITAETRLLWNGYAKGLEDLLAGAGAELAAKDAALAQMTQRSGACASASLPVDTRNAPIQKNFPTAEEFEVTGNHVAHDGLDTAHLLKNVAISVVDILDDKHPVAGRDGDDDGLAHEGSVGDSQADQFRPDGIEVWHLIGDQGTGKSFYLQHLSKAIGRAPYLRSPVVEIEAWELGQVNGRIDRALEDHGPCSIVAITYNHMAEGRMPSYWMNGDRIMSFPKGVRLDAIAAEARNDAALFATRQAKGGAA